MSGNLRLYGATSGYSQISAPDVAGDQIFVLPSLGGNLVATGNNESVDLGTGNLTAAAGTFSGDLSANNLVLPDGGGITFGTTYGSSGTGDSKVLDDYEEGTWTVTLRGGAALSPTHTATPLAAAAHNAKYVKIGNKVFFHFYERWNISSWTGSWVGINIELPFTPDNYAPIAVSYWSSFFNTAISSAFQPSGYVDPNGLCRLTLQAITQSGESDNHDGTIQLSSSAGLMISGIYTTA